MLNFFNPKIKKSNDLAERIFEYRVYQPYINSCPDKQVRFVCKDCTNIQESLNKVIEYCEEPVTPKARYLYAITYAWSRVIYNERAIYYLEQYLSGDLYAKYTDTYEKRLNHLGQMYDYLIDCYKKDLKFDKALEVCDYFLTNINENDIYIHYQQADIFKRQNKLQLAISSYENAKKHAKEKNDLIYIQEHIQDVQNKIRNNYIFKPRLKERKRLKINSDEIFELKIKN